VHLKSFGSDGGVRLTEGGHVAAPAEKVHQNDSGRARQRKQLTQNALHLAHLSATVLRLRVLRHDVEFQNRKVSAREVGRPLVKAVVEHLCGATGTRVVDKLHRATVVVP
jgi:hypothetical protein